MNENLDSRSVAPRNAYPPLVLSILIGSSVLIIFLFTIVILISPHFGPIDDPDFLDMVTTGEWFPFSIDISLARFYPLDGQELNLVSWISTEPFAFYLVNAAELTLIALVFCDTGRKIAGITPSLTALLVLILTPGFVFAWTQLLVPDRDAVFLFTVFIWCYFRFERRQTIGWALGALVAANLALYEKEPGFIMLGVFCLLRIYGQRSLQGKHTRQLDLCLLVSAAVFASIYYFLVYRHRGPVPYGQPHYENVLLPARHLIVLSRHLVSYASTDPVLLFLLLPLALWRAQAILRQRRELDPIADPMLAAALSYMSILFFLNLNSPYYWLPAYAFGLPALISLWRTHKSDCPSIWRIGGVASLLLLLVSSVPFAISIACTNEYIPRNYQGVVSFLTSAITEAAPGQTVKIYFEDVTADDIDALSGYLGAAGIKQDRFDIRCLRESMPRSGDYLIVSPLLNKDISAYRKAIEPEYELVWRSVSPYAIPDRSLKVLLRYLAIEYVVGQAAGIANKFDPTVDYFVYVKR